MQVIVLCYVSKKYKLGIKYNFFGLTDNVKLKNNIF